MPNGILEVKQIKQLSADGGETVVDVENKTIDGVAIGGTTPAAGTFSSAVVEANTSSDAVRITQTGSGNALVVEDSSPDSTPFVVANDGKMIAGYTSPIAAGSVTPFVQIQGISGTTLATYNWASATLDPARLALAKSKSGSINTRGIVSSGTSIGVIQFLGDDGTSFVNAASITAAIDGTPGTNDMPGRLVFSTTADNENSPTERMRIDSNGNVGIGTDSPDALLEIAGEAGGTGATNGSGGTAVTPPTLRITNTQVYSTNDATYNVPHGAIEFYQEDVSSNYPAVSAAIKAINLDLYGIAHGLAFYTNDNATTPTERMRITETGAVLMPDVYNDTVTGRDLYISSTGQLGYVSSVRESKTNIEDLPDISWLYQLNPVKFQYRVKDKEENYTDEADQEIQYGLIAEDVAEVNPNLVFGDETENGFELRGIQYSRLIAPMLKAIQEQQALIESQQAQIDALSARLDALENPPA